MEHAHELNDDAPTDTSLKAKWDECAALHDSSRPWYQGMCCTLAFPVDTHKSWNHKCHEHGFGEGEIPSTAGNAPTNDDAPTDAPTDSSFKSKWAKCAATHNRLKPWLQGTCCDQVLHAAHDHTHTRARVHAYAHFARIKTRMFASTHPGLCAVQILT